ncbi:nocturnin-like [Eucyclogobius newberryi]|uniref:nocturnin-like n=1 Tax=Eucyclogobius newberryi TaxID=166745 RepID=UPI003B5AB11F
MKRCSALARGLWSFSRGARTRATGGAVSQGPGPRHCGVSSSRVPLSAARALPGSAAAETGGPMGSGSSRMLGTLAQPDLFQDEAPELDPEQLLQECERVLQARPPRPHRDMVYCGPGPHDHGPPIRIMQWNILAQALGEGKDGFIRCPLEALQWHQRKYLILEEILTYRPDILCLQEVDHYYDTLGPIMSGLGYTGSFLAKPWSPCLDVERNNGPDGCALFFRSSRFSLSSTAHLRLSAMMLPTNQVAIVQRLECRATGRGLCVAVTHLKARSGWERLRSAQGADLLHSLQSITARSDSALPLVVCGDFNAEPTEEVYRRFSRSPLGLDSAYKLLSVDGRTEPSYTTWKIRQSGENRSTLDYIWYSRDVLRVHTLLDIPTEEQIGPDRLPSYHYPSDHLSLLCDLCFTQEPARSCSDITTSPRVRSSTLEALG